MEQYFLRHSTPILLCTTPYYKELKRLPSIMLSYILYE